MTERFPGNSCSGMVFSTLCNTDDCNKESCFPLCQSVVQLLSVPCLLGMYLRPKLSHSEVAPHDFPVLLSFSPSLNLVIALTMHIDDDVKTAELMGSLSEALSRKEKLTSGIITATKWTGILKNNSAYEWPSNK